MRSSFVISFMEIFRNEQLRGSCACSTEMVPLAMDDMQRTLKEEIPYKDPDLCKKSTKKNDRELDCDKLLASS